MRGPRRSLPIAVILASLLVTSSAFAAPVPETPDGLRAYSIIPPGQSGFVSLGDIASSDFGPHVDDQREMYASLVDDDDVTEAELSTYFHSAQFGPGDDIEEEYTPSAGSRVYRDGFGIPHVYGDTDEDAAFALGYVAAEDRLWQMDLLRHASRGDLASFLGPGYEDYDVGLRTEGYTVAEVQAMFDSLDDEFGADGTLLQDMFVAYSDGVNARMDEVRGNLGLLPVEYGARSVEDWAPTDTIYMAILQLRQFGETAGHELENAAILENLRKRLGRRAGNRAFDDIQWRNDKNSYPTIPAAEGRFPSQDVGPIDPTAVALPDDAEGAASALRADGSARGLRVEMPASNFVGVGAAESETGNPLQFGAPQVGYTVPQFFMEIDVHSPSFDFRGPALPGASLLVPLGRGIDHAWSLTTGMSDGVDTRIEKLCEREGGAPTEDSTGYVFNDECLAMESRTETVEVMGGESQTVTIYRTVHGPVVATATVNGEPVAVTKERAFWMNEIDSVVAFLRASKNTMDSVEEFSEAMSVATMTFNAVYVDPESLAYFHVGRYPVRAAGVDPMLPSWGTGEWEWQGFIAFEDQPHVINPAQGWLVNWNNQPARDWANGDRTHWGPTHRVKLLSKRMSRLVRGDSQSTLSDVVDVIREAATADGNAVLLGPRMMRMLEFRRGTKRAALATLRRWVADGAHRTDEDRDDRQDFGAAVALFDAWYERVAGSVLNDELSGIYGMTIPISDDPSVNNGSSYYSDLGNLLWNSFGRSTRSDMSRNYCDNIRTDRRESCARQVRRAFSSAVASLTKRFGAINRWRAPADYIEFDEVGALSAEPIPWQNRGTYNHAVEVTGL